MSALSHSPLASRSFPRICQPGTAPSSLGSASTPVATSSAPSAPSRLVVASVRLLVTRERSRWTFRLAGGFAYRIVVRGGPGSDLDAYLRDEGGILIDADDDGAAYCMLEVEPRWAGLFTLEVVNRSHRSTRVAVTVG